MWFKNATIYKFNPSQLPSIDDLRAALLRRPFSPCLGLDWFSEGWAIAASHDGSPLLSVRDAWLIKLKREDKVLPAGVIRDLLDAKISQLEDQEFRKIGRKEKQALKEQITDDLLPRAFPRSNMLAALIDTRGGWLMVDTATASKAENLLSCLRDASPAFPAALVHTVLSPQGAMSDWLLHGVPKSFELDNDCKLRAPGEYGAEVSYRHQNLASGEVAYPLELGKQVIQLGLIWRERIRFVLTDTLQLRRIQFLDVIQDEAAQAGDDMATLTEATLLLMAEELGALWADLIAALGGEQS